jgi:hypothetical protein
MTDLISTIFKIIIIIHENISAVYLNEESKDFIIFFVQVLSLIFLIIYVWKTWQMASATSASVKASERMLTEIKDTRDQESAPYVIPYIDIDNYMMFFGIKNIGKTVAKDIRLHIEPEFKSTLLGDKVKELHLIKNGVSSLSPGQSIYTIFDVSNKYFSRADFPIKYSIKITYEGGIRKDQREHEQVLDLLVYKELIQVEEKRITDVVDELKKSAEYTQGINDNLKNINKTLATGISLKNPELIVTNFQIDNGYWEKTIVSKLKELKVLLSIIPKDSGYNFSEDMLQRVKSLLNQITFITANCPYDSDAKICNTINSIAFNILDILRPEVVPRANSEEFDKKVLEYEGNLSELIKSIKNHRI